PGDSRRGAEEARAEGRPPCRWGIPWSSGRVDQNSPGGYHRPRTAGPDDAPGVHGRQLGRDSGYPVRPRHSKRRRAGGGGEAIPPVSRRNRAGTGWPVGQNAAASITDLERLERMTFRARTAASWGEILDTP